jgi:hypothetical protein
MAPHVGPGKPGRARPKVKIGWFRGWSRFSRRHILPLRRLTLGQARP